MKMNFYKINWQIIKEELKSDLMLLGIIIPIITIFVMLKTAGALVPK